MRLKIDGNTGLWTGLHSLIDQKVRLSILNQLLPPYIENVMNQTQDNQDIDMPEFYHSTHYNKAEKRWTSPECEIIYVSSRDFYSLRSFQLVKKKGKHILMMQKEIFQCLLNNYLAKYTLLLILIFKFPFVYKLFQSNI